MNEVNFIVYGEPIGKMRHRSMVLPNGMIHNYNTKKNTDYENSVRLMYKRQCPNIYFVGEIEVVINAYFKIPQSWSKKKKQAAIDNSIRPCVKSDADNISKIILDSLNNVAYKDDKDVCDLHIHKWYSNEPRVEITIIGNWVKV